jgi:hypothetical protein
MVGSTVNTVILHMTTSHPPLLDRLIKYIDMINHGLEKLSANSLYIEVIEGGLLYIFKDFAAFEKMHPGIPKIPEFIKKRIFKIPLKDEESVLGNQLRSPAEYPHMGMQFYIQSSTHPLELLFPIISKHYSSFHPDIEVSLDPPNNRIIINFRTYAAARRHFEVNYYATSKAAGLIAPEFDEK